LTVGVNGLGVRVGGLEQQSAMTQKETKRLATRVEKAAPADKLKELGVAVGHLRQAARGGKKTREGAGGYRCLVCDNSLAGIQGIQAPTGADGYIPTSTLNPELYFDYATKQVRTQSRTRQLDEAEGARLRALQHGRQPRGPSPQFEAPQSQASPRAFRRIQSAGPHRGAYRGPRVRAVTRG
jgi:hypothetical protein